MKAFCRAFILHILVHETGKLIFPISNFVQKSTLRSNLGFSWQLFK